VQDERLGLPSASGFERIHGEEGCPASFLLEQHLHEEGDQQAAKRGERIHAVLEGRYPMASLSYSDKICAERIAFEEGRLVEELGFEGATQIKEQRFWVKDSKGKKLFSGKPDVVHVLHDRALVINYKTGHYAPTPIKENKQMRCELLVTANGGNFLFKELTGALIHPNAPLPDKSISQYETVSIEALQAELPAYQKTAIEAMNPDAPFRPSPKNCRWCKGKKTGACAAYALSQQPKETQLSL
jgi:hypothetical protein